MNKPLFHRDTRAIVYGMQPNAVQRMLDFDYACRRDTPSVAAVINPTGRRGTMKSFFGSEEILIPVYQTLGDCMREQEDADALINFSSFRSAFETSMEALAFESLRSVAVIAEGVAERHARILAREALARDTVLIGPATVGGLKAGAFRIGNTGGTIENVTESLLHRPGSVGLVTKSGGMLNEMFNILARYADGANEGIAIGGDLFPGTTLSDHVRRYEANPEIRMIVVLGELGGREEHRIADMLKNGEVTKPLVAWVSGTCAPFMPARMQFGHAGARAASEGESAAAKNAALRAAGAIVPSSFNDIHLRIQEVYSKLRASGTVAEASKVAPRRVPINYSDALRDGLIRKSTSITSTISDERGTELRYAGVPISSVVGDGMSLTDVVGLLWFGKRLPESAAHFIQTVLVMVADHGPAVAGAHNAIVTARAGKDIPSALSAGLLTIGDRFGGAINGAALEFKRAYEAQLSPAEFVDEMKERGKPIPGIGHRVKSVQNPDVRVTLMKEYAKEHFAPTLLLDYALEVEKITTAKRNNLILNVDGCIAVTFIDMIRSSGVFSEDELDQIIDLGYLNAFFILGRSIGIIGHILDQYRNQAGLYRHPWDDILYRSEPGAEGSGSLE